MKLGTIKFYSKDRNFGFLAPSVSGEPDLYFSSRACNAADIPSLKPGCKVLDEPRTSFQVSRPAAKTVKLAGVPQ